MEDVMIEEVPGWQRSFARSMRKEPTKAENVLWQMLRGKKLNGLKFKRQVPLGPYIADFVCHDSKLIVEADGEQHAESASDMQRDRYFADRGYRVLRFWNDEVLDNSDGVALTILHEAGHGTD